MAAVGALVLVASFVNYLTHNGYPLARLEVGVVLLGLVALSSAMGVVYAACGRALRAALVLLLCFSAVQINFDGKLLVSALALGLFLVRPARIPILASVAAAMLAGDIAAAAFGGDAATADRAQADAAHAAAHTSTTEPVLLHIVVDEHIGIAGFPTGTAGLASARDEVASFYLENGFRLFAGAYSRFNNTVNALPAILNLGRVQPWAPGHLDGIDLVENAYFDSLESAGFHLRVYESDYITYCGQEAVDRCSEYGINDLGPVATSGLSVAEKASVLAYGFGSLSAPALMAGGLYDRFARRSYGPLAGLPLIELGDRGVLSSVGAIGAFDRLIADLRTARPGDAFFAHLLLPHYPYVVDPECRLKPIRAWGLRHSLMEPLQRRQMAYADQVRCVTRKVAQALAALDESAGGGRSIVLVHSDHGSRITQRDPTVEALGSFSDDDVIASHSALFAVRAAGIASGRDDRVLPVSRLLRAMVDSDFRSAEVALPDDFVPRVMLVHADAKPDRPYALPTRASGEDADAVP